MKKTLCIILAIALVLGLAACGGPKKGSPEAAADTLMTGIKEFDLKKIQSVLKDQADADDLNLDDETFGPFFDLMKKWASKLTYKLGKSEENGEKATVPVDVTYTDASELIAAAMTEYISTAMSKVLSGEEVSEENMVQMFTEIIDEKSKTEKIGTADSSLTLSLEKVDGQWKLVDLPDDLLNVLTSNLMSAFEGMFDDLIDLGD